MDYLQVQANIKVTLLISVQPNQPCKTQLKNAGQWLRHRPNIEPALG